MGEPAGGAVPFGPSLSPGQFMGSAREFELNSLHAEEMEKLEARLQDQIAITETIQRDNLESEEIRRILTDEFNEAKGSIDSLKLENESAEFNLRGQILRLRVASETTKSWFEIWPKLITRWDL